MQEYLDFHIRSYLPRTLGAKWSFQTFKKPLSDCFGPKCKCKDSSYIDNTKVLLRSKLNLSLVNLL